MTTLDRRIVAEQLDTLLRSEMFAVLVHEVFIPKMRAWRDELVFNTALDESTRRGYQHALIAVQEGISSCYEKGHVQMPPWLQKELMLDAR
jgi:hypothetical protein